VSAIYVYVNEPTLLENMGWFDNDPRVYTEGSHAASEFRKRWEGIRPPSPWRALYARLRLRH